MLSFLTFFLHLLALNLPGLPLHLFPPVSSDDQPCVASLQRTLFFCVRALVL